MRILLVFFALCVLISQATALQLGKEEDWGEGLKVLATHIPEDCKHKARKDDVISYHYIGKLASSGQEFGKSFDYNSPYIVALGQRRIIAGMDRGLLDTCLWERRRITIPPHLGYGTRGVGEMIPPNATLVFYIRMIKIERNGAVLGVEENLENMWKQGMQSYSDKRWQEAIESIEQSLKLYEMYQNATKLCLKACVNTKIDLTKQEQTLVDKISSTDPLFQQFLVYSAHAKCIKECKVEHLPPALRQPDPFVLKRFQRREPYAFLHYAYYQMKNYEEGMKCINTYYFHNPNDSMAINSLKFYRSKLNISQDHLMYREPGQLAHNTAYIAGVKAYRNQRWLEAVDKFELAVSSLLEAMKECRLMCEDFVFINLTHPQTSVNRQEKMDQEEMFQLDSMEWHQLAHSLVKSLLECRTQCLDKMATINGVYKSKYLLDHFNHLQFAYFKLGLLKKAAKSAATCLIFEPSNTELADNVKYYHSQGVALEDSDARKYISLWHSKWETEERLLQYAVTGHSRKKHGLRGDDSRVLSHHQEL